MVRGHHRNVIGAVFTSIRLTKLDPGNLRNRVSFIGWFQQSAQQCCFRDWLPRKLRVNARTTKKEKFARAILVCCLNHIVLYPQILEKEFDWKIIVCLNPTDLR